MAAQLREHYPALFLEVVETSVNDPRPSIIGGFPADKPPESPGVPNTEDPTRDSSTISSLPDISEESMTTPEPAEEELTVTGAGRISRPPDRYGLGLLAEYALLLRTAPESPDEPTVKQALSGPEKKEWNSALQREVDAIQSYGTWEEASPPTQARYIGTKWVLRKMRDENGKLVKYKARLTAKGFAQVPGVNYDETFTAVIRTDTIRLLLAHCVQNQLTALQYDIESAYLNALLEEEIYLTPPPMVNVTPGKVLHLRRSLYSLKQAARCWADTLAKVLATPGFQRSEADPALFINPNSSEFLGVHVDNLLYVAKQDCGFGDWLNSHFTVKVMGIPRYLLSIELECNTARTAVRVSQKQYLTQLIRNWLRSGSHNVQTPPFSIRAASPP